MTMPASRVARPSTIEEAVRLLADNGPEAVIIAGGTDVVPNLQMKLFTPRVLVDIKPIRALQGITIAAAGALRLDRKSIRLNSSHLVISYAVFCLKKKITQDEFYETIRARKHT